MEGITALINYFELEKHIKAGDIRNAYVFFGTDENLIKHNIQLITDKVINPEIKELNYVRIDGDKADFQTLENACETLPVMSDKKVVEIYRADFLDEKVCNSKKEKDKMFTQVLEYCKNIPNHCILILYIIFESERYKPGRKIEKIDKVSCTVRVDKLKGEMLRKKVKELFLRRGKNIERSELVLFCNEVDNNMNIIENEVEKLCSYTEGREIKKEDIYEMLPQKNDKDIFNLVDLLSQKKIKNALDVLHELIFKGEKITYILFMIQRQFKLLLDIKIGIQSGKNKENLIRELKLHPYVCEKMMLQSKKFEIDQIEKILEICLETENRIKSMSTNNRIEMEMLIVNAIAIR